MQRIQDNPPAANALPGLTSAPSQPSQSVIAPVPAPVPASRARRGSAYPPLSHQDQILKAMTRSSTLPSLSISIPPSPVQDPLPDVNTPPPEPRPTKEERTKTVTFSDPDEESDLSDQSSICQSPSWEGWSKRTKRAKQSSKEEQADKQARKRGNKLSEAPPQSPLPTSTARSASAPQLDTPKADMAAITILQPAQREIEAHAQASQGKAHPPSAAGTAKPKSKRTIFGFKLQNGYSDGEKKPPGGDAESARLGQGKSLSAIAARKHHSLGPGLDHGSLGSLHSATDPSNRSQSSLDKRPPMVRPPSSGSNHARTQSLLSSTLNKLRGPSYLYHRPPEKRHSNSHVIGSESPRPSVQSEDRPNSSGKPTPTPTMTSFPRKAKHKATVSDTASVAIDRSREHRPPQSRNTNRDCDSPEPPEVIHRHNQATTTHAQGQDSTSRKRDDVVQNQVESERSQQVKEDYIVQHADGHRNKVLPKTTQHKARHESPIGKSSRINHSTDSPDDVEQDLISSSHDEDYTSAHENQPNYASSAHRRRRKHDNQKEHTKSFTSTTRPTSRGRESSPLPTSNRSKDQLPPNESEPGKTVASSHDIKPSLTRINMTAKVPKAEQEKEDKLRLPLHPLRPKKSTDYFSFITESYAPPSLELRSPLENLLQTLSQQTLTQVEVPKQAEEGNGPRRPSSRQAVRPGTPATPETRTATPKAKGGSGVARRQEPRDSPATPAHIPDHELPSFEPLTAPSKATKKSNDPIMESAPTRQSRQHETSRTASERSSSSTFGDAPPSPSSMTTPDSSRPHSHKSRPPSHLDLCRTVAQGSISTSDEKTKPRAFPLTSRDRSSSRSRPTSKDANVADDSWSRSALPIDLDNYSSVSLSGPDALSSTPALISTPTSMTFADALKEEIAEELGSKGNHTDSLPPRAQSALDLASTSFLPPLKHQSLNPKKNTSKLSVTATTAPSSPLSEHPEEHLRPALKKSRTSIGTPQDASVLVSTGAAYLQEARKTVNGVPVPATSRALRPQFTHRNTTVGAKGVPASTSASGRAEPMAKMLVECCSCHFFHDMPARVYECMAKPDSVVEDKTLGVSAAITTMVKCPWCSHGMTTQCCAGYAAVVYLKEKLHGK